LRIDLDEHAVPGARFEHRGEIERITLARQQQSSGGMPEHGGERVRHRIHDALGHLFLGARELAAYPNKPAKEDCMLPRGWPA
jgi:hypothetical protein